MKELDASQMPVGQMADVLTPKGEVHISGSVDGVGEMPKDSYLDELRFMEEMVEIFVHESTDQNADNPVPLGNNGIYVFVDRGVPTKLKRKFVDAMIVKSTRITTPEYINGAGERAFKINQTSALKYPFSMISDPSPKRGTAWLRRRIAEAI